LNDENAMRDVGTTTFADVLNEANKLDGIFLEFGVATGTTIRVIADYTDHRVYGFDSFKGLPESWNGVETGYFACDVPDDLPENVSLVVGLFQETLEKFLDEHDDPIAFVHIDCDLYSSTKYVLDTLGDRLDGTVVAFDELIDYGGNLWKLHEWKALNEFLEEHGFSYKVIGKYGVHQVAMKLFKKA
jgi:hypothetical protein